MSEVENTPKKRIKIFTRKMQASLVLVFCVILLVFCGLGVRLFILFNEDGERYQKRVLSQNTYISNEIPYKRGDITDRKGTLLATSEKEYNLIIDPKTILSNEAYFKEPTLKILCDVYGFEYKELNEIITTRPDSQYYVLKKNLSFEEKTAFDDAKAEDTTGYIRGVTFEEQYNRVYPQGSLASDVVGFTYSGNTADWGVEGYYCDELNGTNGRRYGYFDSELRLDETVKEAINGHNVVLTLDSDMQRVVEKIVKEYNETEGADNVGVLVMNPNNGDILAMYSTVDYDLNDPRDLSKYYSADQIDKMNDEEQLKALNAIWRNFCVSDGYEPGSTYKPFTVAACLEEKTTGKDWVYTCDGGETVAGTHIGCVKRTGHGDITLTESLMFSCNDVMMQISSVLGRDSFYKYNKLFGIGGRTGIDLPGESLGLGFTEEQLNPQELATSSFGQGQTVTMIQMASGFSSLINGGYYYRPHVMKEITNDAGLTVESYDKILIRKTVTKDTSDFIRHALYETVEEGTAKKAKARGYKVGGKTGTAEKQPRGDGNYVVSFMGFAPYDAPEAVVYVIIDQPHVEDQTKCTSASVLAGKIIEEGFPILGIYPTEPIVKEEEDPNEIVTADDIISADEASAEEEGSLEEAEGNENGAAGDGIPEDFVYNDEEEQAEGENTEEQVQEGSTETLE